MLLEWHKRESEDTRKLPKGECWQPESWEINKHIRSPKDAKEEGILFWGNSLCGVGSAGEVHSEQGKLKN